MNYSLVAIIPHLKSLTALSKTYEASASNAGMSCRILQQSRNRRVTADRSPNLVMVCDRTADAACGLVKYICHDNYISIHGQTQSLFTLQRCHDRRRVIASTEQKKPDLGCVNP